jgi:death-on-curing protein
MNLEGVRFLSMEEVALIHQAVVALHGGSIALRDRGLLESAVAVPQTQFSGQYLHPDIASMSAAYLFHLCNNHPFIDGNKRVALAAAETFLRLNRTGIQATNDELVELTMQVAKGILAKEDVAAYIRSRLTH